MKEQIPGGQEGRPKEDAMENELNSLGSAGLFIFNDAGQREADYGVGFSCFFCFFACVFAFVLLCFLSYNSKPLSPMTPLKLPMSLEDFIFVNTSTINIKELIIR